MERLAKGMFTRAILYIVVFPLFGLREVPAGRRAAAEARGGRVRRSVSVREGGLSPRLPGLLSSGHPVLRSGWRGGGRALRRTARRPPRGGGGGWSRDRPPAPRRGARRRWSAAPTGSGRARRWSGSRRTRRR